MKFTIEVEVQAGDDKDAVVVTMTKGDARHQHSRYVGRIEYVEERWGRHAEVRHMINYLVPQAVAAAFK